MSHLASITFRFLLLVVGLLAPFNGAVSAVFDRPVPPDGGPTEVRCTLAVLDLDEISDAKQNFTVNAYAHVEWLDPREAHGGEGLIAKRLDEVWHPHLFFVNKQRTWSGLSGKVLITPEGGVKYRQQFWGDFSQPMNLHDYPFDEQVFALQLVASGPEKYSDLKLIANPNVESFISEDYSVADWEVMENYISTDSYRTPNGIERPSFAFLFSARRLPNHHLIKIVAPLLMIVILSWVVFWLDPSEGGSQLGVAVTSFLTVIAYHVALSTRLPQISYLTRLDVFVFGATLLVFLAMLEVVATTGLARTNRIKMALWLDRSCRLVFPGVMTLITVYAFLWH